VFFEKNFSNFFYFQDHVYLNFADVRVFDLAVRTKTGHWGSCFGWCFRIQYNGYCLSWALR